MNLENLKSAVEGAAWPAIPGMTGANIMAVLYQLEETQWFSPAKIQQYQFQQLNNVWRHALATVPYYRQKLTAAGFAGDRSITPAEWQHVPVLPRQDVQEHEADLQSRTPLKTHGKKQVVKTSGSTGMPIKVTGTGLTSLIWNAITLRDHFWHKRDFGAKLAVIRHSSDAATSYPGRKMANWGPPAVFLFNTGEAVVLSSNTDIAMQAKWLLDHEPDYILSYPSNLSALAQYFLMENKKLANLKQVRALGEIVNDEIRAVCREAWNVLLSDMYSAQEVGYIALQCPEHENNYHVQSENVFVEIVDEHGSPCEEGDVGRVLVTTLHNFAMPLIRYEIGDYAEVGKPCQCGRGLPVINEILGRKRNMLILPNGERNWPSLGLATGREELPYRQFQIVQKSINHLEARLVAARPFTPDEERRFTNILQEALQHPFTVEIVYLEDIPRSKGGKFEDFISEIA